MEEFIGTIKLFAGHIIPRGWMLCQGQLLIINQNQALYSIIGTTYGGDGRTTFALPDFRGNVPIGPFSGGVNLGGKMGSQNITIQKHNLPSIGGNVNVTNGTITGAVIGNIKMDIEIPCNMTGTGIRTNNPNNNYISINDAFDPSSNSNANIFSNVQDGKMAKFTASTNVNLPVSLSAGNLTFNTALGGNSDPINNMQPSLGVNFIICVEGYFPYRRILIDGKEVIVNNYNIFERSYPIGSSNVRKKVVRIDNPFDPKNYIISPIIQIINSKDYTDVFATSLIGDFNKEHFEVAICRIDGDSWGQDLNMKITFNYYEK